MKKRAKAAESPQAERWDDPRQLKLYESLPEGERAAAGHYGGNAETQSAESEEACSC